MIECYFCEEEFEATGRVSIMGVGVVNQCDDCLIEGVVE